MPLVLLAAVAASVVTHLTVLFLPDGDWLPAGEAAPVVLQAELKAEARTEALGKFPVASKNPAKPARKRQPIPPVPVSGDHESSVIAEAPSTTQTPVLPELPPADEFAGATARVTTPPVSPPGQTTSGWIRYRVFKGTRGFEVGQARHSWEITANRYALVSVTETSGLAGLFYPVKITLQSQGQFSSEGFVPETFRTLRQGETTQESADFDWPHQQVRLARDGKDRPLLPGSQDMVSFPFQLAYQVAQLGGERHFPMSVVTGKRYDAFHFEWLDEGMLETPAGTLKTLHLKAIAPGSHADTTEVWLAEAYQYLPIKIRFTDRNGDVFEQVAEILGIEKKQEKP